MGKILTREEVLVLARLARLKLTDDEIEQYRSELGAILQYVEQLGDADTTGLSPTSQVTGLSNVYRDDSTTSQLATPEALLNGVPHVSDGYIQVRRMI